MKTVVPYFEYVINYDYIAGILCINSEKPEMKCNGKCYLNKQLSKADEKENAGESTIPSLKLEKLPVIICDQDFDFSYAVNKSGKLYLYFNKIFNPGHSSKPLTPPPQC